MTSSTAARRGHLRHRHDRRRWCRAEGRRQRQEGLLRALRLHGRCDEAPDICLGVPVLQLGPLVPGIVKRAIDGTYTTEWTWFGPDWKDINNADTSGVGYAMGNALGDNKAKLEEFITGLGDGSIDLFTGPLIFQDDTVFLKEGEKATPTANLVHPAIARGYRRPPAALNKLVERATATDRHARRSTLHALRPRSRWCDYESRAPAHLQTLRPRPRHDDVSLTVEAGRFTACWARTAPARARWSKSSAASSATTPARSRWTAGRGIKTPAEPFGRAWACCTRTRWISSPAPWWTISWRQNRPRRPGPARRGTELKQMAAQFNFSLDVDELVGNLTSASASSWRSCASCRWECECWCSTSRRRASPRRRRRRCSRR